MSTRQSPLVCGQDRDGPAREMTEEKGKSSRGWTRTSDKPVNSRLLYQLSYAGMYKRWF